MSGFVMRDITGPGATSFDGRPGHVQSVQGQPVQGQAGESPVPGESEARPTSGRREVRVVPKPWGHETIWAHTDRYVGKILHIRAGEALSVQYHERKDETVYLLRGEMIYRVEQDGELRDMQLREGESFRIVPGTVHQMEAVTDCDVLEASTPELDDVVRLTDRYGREGTSTP